MNNIEAGQCNENILSKVQASLQTDKPLIFEHNIAKPNKQLNLVNILFPVFSSHLLPDGEILMLFLQPKIYSI